MKIERALYVEQFNANVLKVHHFDCHRTIVGTKKPLDRKYCKMHKTYFVERGSICNLCFMCVYCLDILFDVIVLIFVVTLNSYCSLQAKHAGKDFVICKINIISNLKIQLKNSFLFPKMLM